MKEISDLVYTPHFFTVDEAREHASLLLQLPLSSFMERNQDFALDYSNGKFEYDAISAEVKETSLSDAIKSGEIMAININFTGQWLGSPEWVRWNQRTGTWIPYNYILSFRIE
jgi:hypothetical protein